MNFLEKVKTLIKTYDCEVRDRAVLYGVSETRPPLAKHIIFEPMPFDIMQNMVANYKLEFPQQLLAIYTAMNGADLFWTVCFVGKKKIRIPINCLSIYGIPLTYDREHIEPFNISIEDLNRPKGTPDNWLKFGSFYRPENLLSRFDLFVEVEQGGVFAIEHDADECCVTATWDSIDTCLCYIFDLLLASKLQDESI